MVLLKIVVKAALTAVTREVKMRAELILACLGMTAVTFLSRALLTVSVARIQISPFLERFLAVIPFAVLTALVTPYLLATGNSWGGAENVLIMNPYLLAGIPTLLVSYRTRNLLLSVGVGVIIYMVLGMWV
jgi:branched-subunit amino acid transport protein